MNLWMSGLAMVWGHLGYISHRSFCHIGSQQRRCQRLILRERDTVLISTGSSSSDLGIRFRNDLDYGKVIDVTMGLRVMRLKSRLVWIFPSMAKEPTEENREE